MSEESRAIAQPALQTPRLLLRSFEHKDASRVQALAGDLRVARMTAAIPYPYLDGMAEQWIETHKTLWKEQARGVWAICLKNESTLVGCISLITQLKHNSADLGYWIGYEYWNHGICSEAAQSVIDLGFSVLKLARIGASHLSINPASGRVMQKLGMRYEGTQRQLLLLRGQRYDLAHYGLLADDPQP